MVLYYACARAGIQSLPYVATLRICACACLWQIFCFQPSPIDVIPCVPCCRVLCWSRRPHRARMVYSLVSSYGLSKQLILQRPVPRSFEELTEFHADGVKGGGQGTQQACPYTKLCGGRPCSLCSHPRLPQCCVTIMPMLDKQPALLFFYLGWWACAGGMLLPAWI